MLRCTFELNLERVIRDRESTISRVTCLNKLAINKISNSHNRIQICVVIRQDESEVGNDLLLISEVLLHFSIMLMSMLKPGTCRRYIIAANYRSKTQVM